MIIRKANQEDVQDMANIFRTESEKNPYNENWSEKDAIKRMEVYLKEKTCFVAVEKNKVKGFIIGYSYKWADKKQAYVNQLFVAGDYQRKGAGAQLIKKFENYFTKRGVKSIILDANLNANAIEFYKKLGFKKNNMIRLEKRF